jgi:Domain of unknown function (DUF1963)
MVLNTRQPPYDVEELFPFLKAMGRRTTRLHPRREAGLPATVSKIGGSILWPPNDTHPVCSVKSCPAVPVIQLRRDDCPSIEFPTGFDLLQILWYPQGYEDWGYNPQLEVYWRDSTKLSPESVLTPVYENHEDIFVVNECRIHPESVIEYPYIDLLNEDQQQVIWKWEKTQDNPMARYQYCLSTCPGTKVGGYPDFCGQDAPSMIGSNGQQLQYLLTLASDEWDGGSFPRWRPIEQKFPPGRTVTEKRPDGRTIQYIKYTPEEEKERERWTGERWSQYRAEQSAVGIDLKYSMNVFLELSTIV